MALFTPRGLKVRLAKPYAFGLMARVYPEIDAFRVLQMTEEVENLPSLATFLAGIAVYALKLPPLQIGLLIFVALGVFRLVHLFGWFVPPFTLLLPVSRVYSLFSGYGILLIALLIFGYWMTGWPGVLAFVLARLIIGVIFSAVEMAWSRRAQRSLGFPFTASERSFFHAFRLAAFRTGVSTDLDVSEEQLLPINWYPVFYDLALKWPVVAQRITDDE